MIRIEYEFPTVNGNWTRTVMFADDFDEAETICNKIDEYGYRLIDVSNYVEEG